MDLRETIIKTVQYGQMAEPAKTELLNLLKLTSFSYNKTNEWSGQKAWGKHKEYIVARIIPEKMEELRKYKSELEFFCGEVYQDNNQFFFEGLEIKPGSEDDLPEDASQEVLFDRIESRIIDEIREAKYVIWIAMAWFKNKKIYDELVKKKRQGLSITIILDKNQENKKAEFDLFKTFETYEMTVPTKFGNTMHDKFCIIDFKTVMHGTFNWTNAANYNKETFNVDKNKPELIEQFADEFMELKREAMNQTLISAF